MAASDDDNKHHAHQESDEDYFYGYNNTDDDFHRGRGSDDNDEDEDDEEIALEVDETNDLQKLQDNFVVLTEADIRHRVEELIAQVAAVLSLSKVEASILLLHYNWSINKVHDAWFVDEKEAREATGLFIKPLIELADDDGGILCGICFDTHHRNSIKSTSCGHPYCNDCWSCYVKTAIADGPGILLLKCPEPSCHAAVGEDLVGLFVSEEEKRKYSRYIVMSYVEQNKMMKWCPGLDCENVINFVAGGDNFDVSCLCTHSFCWNCTQENHRPVDCETVMKWMRKTNSEAENMNYILAFTKPCPKCKKAIEKNKGCNHMSCRPPCSHQFCWLCLKDWGGNHYCNRYNEAEAENSRTEKAKKYVMRYTHYFERWATHRKSMKKAADDLHTVQNEQIDIFAQIQAQTEIQLSFVIEAWQQIVECRRVLTWTYAYGYYLPDEDSAKRNLFEYWQGEAESALERLHDCAEKELAPFLKNQQATKEFIEFRKKLTALTKATRNYFENLVKALQTGLSDVNSQTSSCNVPKKPRWDSSMSTAAAVTGPQSFNRNINHNFDAAEEGNWICSHCTYENHNSSTSCTMCGRGSWTCDNCTFANLRTSTTCVMCSEVRAP